ncbi:aminoglycoside phosphotransferase family protein [Streptomyces mirabilis]|uniref:aminoglycoside phosphotransferase family protein n=1 Tax=Streptomyces mirabilis TaxID=68239 RepID=UPI00332A2F5E
MELFHRRGKDTVETGPDKGAIPLGGGRITPGVVRIGDTVRRPTSSASPFVAALLSLLEERGYPGAPRYLGRDASERDIFSFVPGWVPRRLRPWSDAQIAAAAGLARALHDATRGNPLTGRHPVVCHHDLGPNNTVFQAGTPIAFIDFDQAAPGSPLEDVGYMAWLWCVSSKAQAPPVQAQAAQVRVLADAYGLTGPERSTLIDAMLERQERNVRFWQRAWERTDTVETTAEQIGDRIAWSRREQAYALRFRHVFESALR